jgi:hypothetical protein
MPKEAKEKTAQGVKAFAEYYFELMEYTAWSLDSEPIKASTSRDCITCGESIIDPADQNRASGAWVAGGAYDAEIVLAQIVNNANAVATFAFEQTESVAYNSDGDIFGTIPATDQPVVGSFSFIFDDGWKVSSLSIEEE